MRDEQSLCQRVALPGEGTSSLQQVRPSARQEKGNYLYAP